MLPHEKLLLIKEAAREIVIAGAFVFLGTVVLVIAMKLLA